MKEAILALLALILAGGLFATLRTGAQTDRERALISVNETYGKRVLDIYNRSSQEITYSKMRRIVKEYNSEVRQLERSHLIIPHDYRTMIEELTSNRYTLKFSYIVAK